MLRSDDDNGSNCFFSLKQTTLNNRCPCCAPLSLLAAWAWPFQPPSRANTCILASAHGTPSSTRTSKRGEASRRSSAGRLMKACWSAAATVPGHASALSGPPTTGMRSYSARAAPGRMRGGRDHEASHRAHHQPHELAGAAASDRISPKMPLFDLLRAIGCQASFSGITNR